MFEDVFGYGSPWDPYFSYLLASLPVLIAQMVGLIVALVMLRSRTKPAVMAIIAILLSLALNLSEPLIMRNLWDSVMIGDTEDTVAITVNYFFTSGHAVVWLLLFIAIFGWRKSVVQTGTYARGISSPGPYSSTAAGGTEMPETSARPLSLPHVQMISKGLYLGTIVTCYILSSLLALPGLLLMFSAGRRDEEQIMLGAGLACGSAIPGIIAVVMLLVLIAKLWAAIPKEYARTTPGMAVGLLFIPFFNFYWIFQVYWGWTVDYNRMVQSRELAVPRMPQGLAMTLCVFALIEAFGFDHNNKSINVPRLLTTAKTGCMSAGGSGGSGPRC